MATLTSSVVSATPDFVSGTFGAKDVRLATLGNALPGLFERGDFAVTQRAAGANMSVDIGIGRCYVSPGASTHQGTYLVTSGATYAVNGTTTFNTSADGGITWTAADGSNPRIDLLCIEVKDNAEDASGTTGWRFRIETGTANAGATHQLATTYWPSVPTGCVPIAAIRIPAADSTIGTAEITNLNPIGGTGRAATNYSSTAETTTSTTYARLASPDFVTVYVPSAQSRVRLFSEGQWKISVAAGTQGVALYLNDAQAKARNSTNGAPAVGGYEITSLGTFLSRFVSTSTGTGTNAGYTSAAGATADVSNITTGILGGPSTMSTAEISQLAAGWYVIEQRYKTSANTLTVDERYLWAEVIA